MRYYIPGIISIFFLPVLGIWYLNHHGYLEKKSAINFLVLNWESYNNEPNPNVKQATFEVLENFRTTKYDKIVISSDTVGNKTIFENIENIVTKKITEKDSLKGLKITFEEKARYSDFIRVLDILYKKNAYSYTLEGNSILFIAKGTYNNDNNLQGCFLILDETTTTKETTTDIVKKLFKENKLIYSAYIIFVLSLLFTFSFKTALNK